MKKTVLALLCALSVFTSKAFTLDVSYLQENWYFRVTYGTDIEPRVPGTWLIDGNPVGYGGSQGLSYLDPDGTRVFYSLFSSSVLWANYKDNWFLTPNVPHTVSFAADDGSGLVLQGDEPYYVYDPVGERPPDIRDDGASVGTHGVPDNTGVGCAILGLGCLLGLHRLKASRC